MPTTPGPWPYPAVIAHRGAGRFAPENTLAAMRTGWQHGFTMFEYDVKLTKDGVAILLHDDTIDRTSNGTGNAADYTLAGLAEFDFGAWHSRDYAGEPIPTLYSVAAFTQQNSLCSNIEIKPHTGHEGRTGTEVARLAQRLWATASVPPLLSSFSETALAAARVQAPELPRALLIDHELPADWPHRLRRLDCTCLNMNHEYITHDVARRVTAAGYKMAAYTVNDWQRAAQLLDWGCSAIFTDEIKTLSPRPSST